MSEALDALNARTERIRQERAARIRALESRVGRPRPRPRQRARSPPSRTLADDAPLKAQEALMVQEISEMRRIQRRDRGIPDIPAFPPPDIPLIRHPPPLPLRRVRGRQGLPPEMINIQPMSAEDQALSFLEASSFFQDTEEGIPKDEPRLGFSPITGQPRPMPLRQDQHLPEDFVFPEDRSDDRKSSE